MQPLVARRLVSAVLLLGLAASSLAQDPAAAPSTQLWPELKAGAAGVKNGSAFLEKLANGTGDIKICAKIHLVPSDWEKYTLPIKIDAPGKTIRIRTDEEGEMKLIDWGFALQLLEVTSNTTLVLDGIESQNPGNRSQGIEQLKIEIRGSAVWPTITGQDGHKIIFANSDMHMDIAKCNPDFVEVEVDRLHQMLNRTDTVDYMEGTTVWYSFVPFPAPISDTVTKQQVGKGIYTLNNTNTTCYDSSYHTPSSSGTPSWVWAVLGSVLGCAVLAAVGGALLWRRKKRKLMTVHLAAPVSPNGDLEEGQSSGKLGSDSLSKAGSTVELDSLGPHSHDKMRMQPSGSGELHTHFLRTRFGPIDGVQLGELLGRGAFGRVYRGRWKGAVVAVKVIDHRVSLGKTHDLSREPLLSMSVSHPNIVTTHKMCVVRIITRGGPQPVRQNSSPGDSMNSSGGSGSGGKRSNGSGGGQLVPALAGDGMVEVVSPTDVLQPGLYETWLVSEFCDRGNLAELIAGGKLSPNDPSQRDIWVLLCLLDIAQGLDYLHSTTMIHGDLKPANVLVKAARNDRRGFVAKLADFGLSRMLGHDQSHVDTQSYGTASYAAPELLSEGKLTKAADIYSLAIIMWELTTGSELHSGMGVMQIILQVSQHMHRPEVPENCPAALSNLMQRCWSQDASLRPTAAEVVEDLRNQLRAYRPQVPSAPRPARSFSAALPESAQPAPEE